MGDETSRNFLAKDQVFFCFPPLLSGQSSTDQKHGVTNMAKQGAGGWMHCEDFIAW